METAWFICVAFMLTMYVLLDGFDLGAGAGYLVMARTERERRMILRAIGPVWDGNEVWLIAAGGSLFFAFPLLYASAFSGFYLPLIMVLWLLMIRALAIELRGHIENPLWASFWDAGFFIGSSLLAIVFGAALGNVVRGVPIGEEKYFFAPLWTNLSPMGPEPGVLDWFTVLTGLLALTVLLAHGANFIAVKTEDELNARARRVSRLAWIGTIVIAGVTTIALPFVSPEILSGFNERPYGYALPAIAIVGLVGMGYFNYRKHDKAAFVSSSAFIVGLLTSTFFAVYPKVLPAVEPDNSLTIYNASTSDYSMSVGFIWWGIGMVLAVTYLVVIYRLFRGKVKLDDEGY